MTPSTPRTVPLGHMLSPSSVHRLPNELLSYIFLSTHHERHESCLDEFDYDTSTPRHHDSLINTPLDLSHVCRRWRTLALSISRLWTFLMLTFPITRPHLGRFLHFLRRSKDIPLDIYLDFRDPDWDWDDAEEEEEHDFGEKDMERVLDIITPHASRWRSIEMITDTWEPMHCFLREIKDTAGLQKLQSVRLARFNAYFVRKGVLFHPQSKKKALPLFARSSLSSLKTLSFAGVHVDWEALTTQVIALEELELKYHAEEVAPSIAEFRSLMKSIQNLRLLNVQGWGARLEGTWVKQQRTICLPKVTHFTFGYVDTEYAVEFLSLFVLPALQHLGLEDLEGPLGDRGPLESSLVLDYVASRHRITCPAAAHTPECCARACLPLSTLSTLSFKSIRARPTAISNLLKECQSLKRLVLNAVDPTPFRDAVQASLANMRASHFTLKTPSETSTGEIRRNSCQILLERSAVVAPQAKEEQELTSNVLKTPTKRRALTPRN